MDTPTKESGAVERQEKLEKKLEHEFRTLAADLERTHDPGIIKFIKSSILTRGTTIERIMSVKSARYHFTAMIENDPALHFRHLLIDEALRNQLNDGAPNMAFEIFRVQFKAVKLWQRLIGEVWEKATEQEKDALRFAQDRSSPMDETMSQMIRFAKERRAAERDALGGRGTMVHRRFLQEGQRRGFQGKMDRIKEAFELMASWRQKRAQPNWRRAQ
jgi:hypothetical protein